MRIHFRLNSAHTAADGGIIPDLNNSLGGHIRADDLSFQTAAGSRDSADQTIIYHLSFSPDFFEDPQRRMVDRFYLIFAQYLDGSKLVDDLGPGQLFDTRRNSAARFAATPAHHGKRTAGRTRTRNPTREHVPLCVTGEKSSIAPKLPGCAPRGYQNCDA